jgi:hypothetical protein
MPIPCSQQYSTALQDKELMKRYVVDLPKAFLALGTFEKTSMLWFCRLLTGFNKVFSTKGNLLLCRLANWKLLVHGQIMDNKQVNQLAKETYAMLSHA